MAYTSYLVIEEDLELIPGAPFKFAFGITDSAGAVIDMTGCSLKCDFKVDKTDAEAALTPTADLTDVANGNIVLNLTAEETADVGVTRYFYDCFIFDSEGTLFARLFGKVVILNPVSIL